jgi:hypothetical protein
MLFASAENPRAVSASGKFFGIGCIMAVTLR